MQGTAMKQTPRIPETEWETMKVLWAVAPCSAGRSIELLTRTDPAWHPKTATAFLNPFNFKAFPRRPASFPILESALGGGCASKRTVHRKRHWWHYRA